MAAGRPFDGEALGLQEVGEAVGHGAGLAGAARHGDQGQRGFQQTLALHGGFDAFGAVHAADYTVCETGGGKKPASAS